MSELSDIVQRLSVTLEIASNELRRAARVLEAVAAKQDEAAQPAPVSDPDAIVFSDTIRGGVTAVPADPGTVERSEA